MGGRARGRDALAVVGLAVTVVLTDLPALVDLYGSETWTALEFDGRTVSIADLAASMRSGAALLAQDEGVVAVCSADPIEHTVAVLAAIAAGRVPLLIDHRQPDAAVEEVLARSAATAIVGRDIPGLRRIGLGDLTDRAGMEPVSRAPSELGSILMTSGSTGPPKLVMRSRGADVFGAMGLRISRFKLDLGDRLWLSAPYSGSPFPGIVMAALLARATVVFAPFVVGTVSDFIEDKRITSAYLGPTSMRLVRAKEGLDRPAWAQLRSVLIGGEKLDDDTAAMLIDRFPGRVFNGYGATEITRVAEATADDLRDRPGTVGRALPFHQLKVVEIGGDEAVPIGASGEVLARGGSMFSGYLGESAAGEWYRTGDVGHFDADGFLYVTGRATSVVQVGGNRVSTDEISELLRRHPLLASAAVVAVDDDIWGARLEAFVVADRGAAVDVGEIKSWVRDRVTAYKVPRRFHLLDVIPTDVSGKTSTRTLQAMAMRP